MTSMEQANRNARAGQETLEASGRVIARRLTLMSEAVADPLHADHGELSRMSLEKITALSASTEALVEGAIDLTMTTQKIAEREADHGSQLLNRIAKSRSLAEVSLAQVQWGWEVFGRALNDSQILTHSLLDTQARALSPYHTAVVTNARRLKV